MEIEVQDSHQEMRVFQEQKMKKNLVVVLDGVRDAVVTHHVFKNTTYHYVDNVSER